MAKKLCKACNKAEIDEKYEMCISCLNRTKEINATQDIIKTLERINWNLGLLTKNHKLFCLFESLSGFSGKEYYDIRRKIMEYFKKDWEKEIKIIEKIKEE